MRDPSQKICNLQSGLLLPSQLGMNHWGTQCLAHLCFFAIVGSEVDDRFLISRLVEGKAFKTGSILGERQSSVEGLRNFSVSEVSPFLVLSVPECRFLAHPERESTGGSEDLFVCRTRDRPADIPWLLKRREVYL